MAEVIQADAALNPDPAKIGTIAQVAAVDPVKLDPAAASENVKKLAEDALNDAIKANHDDPIAKLPLNAKNLKDLSSAEKHRIEHAEFHKKHKGHEAMHAEMVIILITMLILGQIALFQWRSRSPKTYNTCTLFLLWIVPMCFSVYYGWYRFVVVWAFFSFVTGLVLRKAVWKTKISPDTPRLVYRVFLFMFRVSLTVGTVGYMCFLFTMLGFNLMFMLSPETAFDFSFLCLWYGFYFGVVVRDLSDVCSTSIAKKVGYYQESDPNSKDKARLLSRQLAPNICAICGNAMKKVEPASSMLQPEFQLRDDTHPMNSRNVDGDEEIIRLNCGHTFHEYCLRGWILIGKKQTCPYCSEKVDTKILTQHPWEKYNHMYAQLLEWLRYLVAWQPILLMLVHGVTWTFGLE